MNRLVILGFAVLASGHLSVTYWSPYPGRITAQTQCQPSPGYWDNSANWYDPGGTTNTVVLGRLGCDAAFLRLQQEVNSP